MTHIQTLLFRSYRERERERERRNQVGYGWEGVSHVSRTMKYALNLAISLLAARLSLYSRSSLALRNPRYEH